jgi:hypothetical protein
MQPHLLLLLDRVKSAPLVLLRPGVGDLLHAYVDLGAGRTMQIRIRAYSDEAAPLRYKYHDSHHVPDGRDRVAVLRTGYCEMLEGTYLPARDRREVEAARKAEEDDD